MTKRKKKLTKTGRRFFQVILVTACAVAALSVYEIANGLYQYHKGKNTYAALLDSEVVTDTNVTLTLPDTSEEVEVNTVDFDQLAKVNPDVVGWIQMADSTIDYPIVQGTDNEYYLTHLFTGEVNNMGCIFVDYRNAKHFADTNTVMYAHHMRNGTMFADLEKYKSQSYYENHRSMIVQTPEATYLLEPFAGLVLSGAQEFVKMNFTSDDDYFDFVNQYISQSTFTSDVELYAQDRFVTMITCSYDYENARYALFAKLTPMTDGR